MPLPVQSQCAQSRVPSAPPSGCCAHGGRPPAVPPREDGMLLLGLGLGRRWRLADEAKAGAAVLARWPPLHRVLGLGLGRALRRRRLLRLPVRHRRRTRLEGDPSTSFPKNRQLPPPPRSGSPSTHQDSGIFWWFPLIKRSSQLRYGTCDEGGVEPSICGAAYKHLAGDQA